MTSVKSLSDDGELIRLIATTKEMITTYAQDSPRRWLLVDAIGQQLVLVRDGAAVRRWPVSTAAAGLDNRDGSGGTPPGVHRIEGKIGADAEPGAVFVSRQPTGDVWHPGGGLADERDLILTRVLTLAGLEPGVNRGVGVDSLARYIYIHGTNQEALIGTPASAGCVRMLNADVCEVFDLVEEGDPVVII